MDMLTFYREATFHIAKMLDSGQALQDFFHYIRELMPLHALSWHAYNKNNDDIRGQTILTKAGLHDLRGQTIPVTPPIHQNIEDLISSRFLLVQSCSHHPLAAEIVRSLHRILGRGEKSMFIIYLEWQRIPRGFLCLFRQADEEWSVDHLEMLKLLDRSFSFAITHMQRFMELVKQKNQIMEEKDFLVNELRQIKETELIGANSGLREIMVMVEQLARVETPVLILGETGVGKEVVANAIQRASHRRNGPYVKVNCGAIPETLIDSELFGHEKGSFTGAHSDRKGKFERAEGGTIFLDEIGELPLQAQIRLLRVLQNREAERIGGHHIYKVNVRILAATNRDLPQMVREGRFRDDLFFRINVFPVVVPPLRHRKQDMSSLLDHFLQKKVKEMNLGRAPKVSKGALQCLMNYNWPGNIRELENLIERALIVCSNSSSIRFDTILQSPLDVTYSMEDRQGKLLSLNEINRQHINRALMLSEGKINGPGGAAELLNIKPNTLRRRMDNLKIVYGRGNSQHFTIADADSTGI